jgi:hypothetical protein
MIRTYYTIALIFLLQVFFSSCNSNPDTEKELPEAGELIRKIDSSAIVRKNDFESILKKYKPISFDTLKVRYGYDEDDNQFSGKELTLKEARTLPIGFTEKRYGKLSGVYACYQFELDASRLGLLTRIPSDYESTSIVLLVFDRKKQEFHNSYFYLGAVNGDAGEIASRVSWLFQAKNKQLQAFVYDYQSYHEIDDTLTTESHSYFLVDCMKPYFDTISSSENQLKKRFKKLLLTEE